MPRYYFRLDGGGDDEGIELSNDDVAREAAHDLFGHMIIDGEAKHGSELLVTADTERTVARLRFSSE